MKELLRILSGLLALVVCISTLRTGKRAGGAGLKAPMSGFVPYANKMRYLELKAIWKYLRSLPPVAPAKL